MNPRKAHILKIFGREPESMDELACCVIKVIAHEHPVVGFAWDIEHRAVSNSHECPMDGKTNWGGREQDAPRNYPGWQGRVWVRYSKPTPSFGNNPFDRSLTYPGTGGWGSYEGPFQSIATAWDRQYGHNAPKTAYPEPQVYSWDYRIFDSDWPGVTEEMRTQMTFNKIAGIDSIYKHKFEWHNPETLTKDAEFIAYYASHPKKEIA